MSDGVGPGIAENEPNGDTQQQPPAFPAAEAPEAQVGDVGEASPMGRVPRRGLIIAGGLFAVAAAGGIAAAVTGSGSGTKNNASGNGGTARASTATTPSASPSPTYPAPTLTTVPANGASGVDPSKPVTVTVANGTITSVQFAGGQESSGTLSGDKSTWTSNGSLNVDSSYQLQIQAAGLDGRNVTRTVSFSTLKPTATLGVLEMWPGDGVSVGVGQPIRVQFTNYVPQSYRAAVEKACAVTTTPAVAGAWHWVSADTMDWRPQDFWKTGTQVKVAFNLAGVRAGQHQYFVRDHSLSFTVRDTDLRLVVDAKKFRATAYRNGSVVRTFPIDTGMDDPRFVTWSGVFAVLGKGNPVEMKADYGNGDKYDEFVNYATQITYSGTYVHSAPWDGEIGHVNSSHGCIHCNPVDATWFYNLAHVGDVVQVTGTGKTVDITNGFGDFTTSWSSWLSGSAYGATIGGTPV
jgi:lipoprotein-anchoring transpeptidase ErfK/SrfK